MKITNSSLVKRFASKLIANFFSLFIGLIIQGIVARVLGPSQYGNFGFIKNFFSKLTSFFDAGTSNALYIKLSQRQTDYKLITFYLTYMTFVASIIILLINRINHIDLFEIILPGQSIFYIYLGLIFSLLHWLSNILNKLVDAFGLTILSEAAKIIQKLLAIFIILVLYYKGSLDLTTFFLYHYGILIFIILFFIILIKKNTDIQFNKLIITYRLAKKYLSEFYYYSHPLFVHSLVGLIVGLIDKWMLQIFSGSEEQGFFWLSYKISAICLIFTTATSELIMREFAISFSENNLREMKKIFRRFVPFIFSISAFFSCFLALQANSVSLIMGGNSFENATVPIMIMSFYPMHQTYGHLNSSIFYATGDTKLYRNIGTTFNIIKLIATYFLIAPEDLYGLNMGSSGLAIALVLTTMLNVNIQLFYNVRLLNLAFKKFVLYQVSCFAPLLLCSFISSRLTSKLFDVNDYPILIFFFSGILYSTIVSILIFYKPILFGLSDEDSKVLKNKMKNFSPFKSK